MKPLNWNTYPNKGRFAGVYQIVNTKNGKRYIGSSVNVRSRYGSHLRGLGKGRHHSTRLQHSWVKYGSIAFEFSILEVVPQEELLACEQKYLDMYQAYDPEHGYNICREGRNRAGAKHSASTKARISSSNQGKKRTEAQIEAMRVRQTGVSPSEETRRKIGASAAGRRHSEESKRKIGEASAKKTMSAEARQRISEANKGRATWSGRTHSEESKDTIRGSLSAYWGGSPEKRAEVSEATRARWLDPEDPLRKSVSEAVSRTHKGRAKDPETRAKMAEGMRRAWVRRKAEREALEEVSGEPLKP